MGSKEVKRAGGTRVVAIDGPCGAGKSTIAKLLAEQLGFRHLDTGSMYRAIAWFFADQGIDPMDLEAVAAGLSRVELEIRVPGRVILCGRDLGPELRTPEIDLLVSPVSAEPLVRRAMVPLQRVQADYGPIVAEGRDMCSVVFPDARWQFYLDASVTERARRRHAQYVEQGRPVTLAEIRADIERRDAYDKNREDSPLVLAETATHVDSSDLTIEQVVALLVEEVRGG